LPLINDTRGTSSCRPLKNFVARCGGRGGRGRAVERWPRFALGHRGGRQSSKRTAASNDRGTTFDGAKTAFLVPGSYAVGAVGCVAVVAGHSFARSAARHTSCDPSTNGPIVRVVRVISCFHHPAGYCRSQQWSWLMNIWLIIFY